MRRPAVFIAMCAASCATSCVSSSVASRVRCQRAFEERESGTRKELEDAEQRILGLMYADAPRKL